MIAKSEWDSAIELPNETLTSSQKTPEVDLNDLVNEVIRQSHCESAQLAPQSHPPENEPYSQQAPQPSLLRSFMIGKRKVKVVPRPGAVASETVPPWRKTVL